MPIPAEEPRDEPTVREPGDFARHPHTGAPYVAHPTETTKHAGKKADLIALAAERGLTPFPEGVKVTIPWLHQLLGGRPKRVQYGRPSSLGGQVENQTNIQKWAERGVVLGSFLDDRDIYAPLRDLDDEQLNLDDDKAREVLDKVAAKAKHTAGCDLAADRGTFVHKLLEAVDRD